MKEIKNKAENKMTDVIEEVIVKETKKDGIVTARDISKTFSNESVQQHVLKNLNLTVYRGDFTVIMGNSGSGKSTLLYTLSGMDRPTLGTVTYCFGGESVEISKYSNDALARFRRDHAGFVFQQNYLNDSMSALDNVMVCGLLKNKDRKDDIHYTFYHQILRSRIVALHHHHWQMEHVHVRSATHDHVPDTRYHIDNDLIFNTVF